MCDLYSGIDMCEALYGSHPSRQKSDENKKKLLRMRLEWQRKSVIRSGLIKSIFTGTNQESKLGKKCRRIWCGF